jgi:uncharacterized protein
MIAVDTNILVYAHRAETPFHAAAVAALTQLAEGTKPWGIPVGCVHDFLSVVSNPKIFSPASKTAQALAQINAWLASPQISILHSGAQNWRILADLAVKAKLQGGQYHDARIAAVCLENGVAVLWSADRDFGRFKALLTLNPLV